MTRKVFVWSAQVGGGSITTPEGATTMPNRPAWVPATALECQCVEDDGVITFSVMTVSHEADRAMTDDEVASVRSMWVDNAALHGPTPVHAANADGTYAGQVMALGDGQVQVGHAPPTTGNWKWDEFAWVEVVDLAELKDTLQCNIDRAAGAARSRYITVAAGQDATYIVKEQQAQTYLANPSGDVPSYIQAEANATGLTPLEAATLIDNTAKAWAVLGPEIEQARRAGNLAVIAAATPADAMTAYNNAVTALNAV